MWRFVATPEVNMLDWQVECASADDVGLREQLAAEMAGLKALNVVHATMAKIKLCLTRIEQLAVEVRKCKPTRRIASSTDRHPSPMGFKTTELL
jgi:hypothetical protein